MASLEEVHLLPNQVCVAVESFSANEHGDLSFVVGEKIIIIRESEMMFWYIAKNEQGEIGTVPGNYLESVAPPPVPAKPKSSKAPLAAASSYEPMQSAVAALQPMKNHHTLISDEEKQMLILMKREERKRLPNGTLVIATATFQSDTHGDLNFRLHEELVILKPTKDLCWYKAHMAHDRSKEGVVPITHLRLVYVSDGESEDIYQTPRYPGHQRIYEDKNDFLTNSGWFSHSGIAMGKEAHLHCLARKARMNYEKFMSVNEAVYLLQFMNEKTFIGKAKFLNEELTRHFECFGKRLKEIREIDDELCHHTNAAGWKLTVWPLECGKDLEVEHAMKIVENDSLMSPDGGMNETMTFTNADNFDKFWEWMSPN